MASNVRNEYVLSPDVATKIFGFDNVDGDSANPRHDQIDLTAIFDALGGIYSDGKNDLQDRTNAVLVSTGDFDGDGKTDIRIGISGLPNFQATLLNSTAVTTGAIGIGAGSGTGDDIAVMSAVPAKGSAIAGATVLAADAAHANDEPFTVTSPAARTVISNFDNISGDGSSHDAVDLARVFDALGGKFSDGVNDAADRAAAIHLVNLNADADGVANDVQLTIDGAPDFQLTFVNPVETARDAFNIGETAGAKVDIVTGGTPSTTTGGTTTPTPIPTPTPTPTPTHAVSADGTTTGAGGAALYDNANNSFSINANHQIVIDGVVDSNTANVTNLLIEHATIYQTAPDPATGGATAGWWQYTPGSGWNNWTQIDHDPRVADGGTGGSTGGSGVGSTGGGTTGTTSGGGSSTGYMGHPASYARLNNGVNVERDQYANISDADLKYLKSIGVENIRIFLSPNEWGNGVSGAMNPETNGNIQWAKTFMDRVVKAGMAVVVTPFAAENPAFLYNANDQASINQHVSWMKEFATFINNHYSTNDVFIETMNEPVMQTSAGAAADNQNWWNIQAKFIGAIHSVNPNLTAVATANMWDGAAQLEALKPYADANVAYAVHYYQPMNFTHQGASWVSWAANLHNVQLSSSDVSMIQNDLNTLHNWATANNAFVTVNEFGAMTTAPFNEKAEFLQTVATAAQKYGFGWDVWDYDKAMSITTLQNGQHVIPDAFLKALGWGQYHTAEADWTTYLHNGTTPATATAPATTSVAVTTVPPATDTTDSIPTASTNPVPAITVTTPVSTTPSETTTSSPSTIMSGGTVNFAGDTGLNVNDHFVLAAADLNKAVTITNFDNVSKDDSSSGDSINLKAIFDALGGKYANDVAARQAALHFQTLDLNHDGQADDVRLTVDGAPNFHVDFIHPVVTAANAFDVGVAGHSPYDNIVIA